MTTGSVAAPIAAHDRVSDVLARDEALVEVFVRHAAHFSKLRNRAMRKVMARLVTVEQAARIGGVPADALVRELNAALGLAPAQPDGRAPVAPRSLAAAPLSSVRPLGAPEVELDVRADLREGREPFSRVMKAVAALPDDAVLHLRAIFEPAPLFTVLGKRGFTHETMRHADDDWSVWFWRPAPAAGNDPAIAAADTATRAPAPADPGLVPTAGQLWLDVRGLEPPEPLMRTLAALETLPEGQELVQVNVRVPQFLIPMLGERGFVCEIDDSRADQVLVHIHRPR